MCKMLLSGMGRKVDAEVQNPPETTPHLRTPRPAPHDMSSASSESVTGLRVNLINRKKQKETRLEKPERVTQESDLLISHDHDGPPPLCKQIIKC